MAMKQTLDEYLAAREALFRTPSNEGARAWWTSEGYAPPAHPTVPRLVYWPDWAARNVTPDTQARLHETGQSFQTWFVYFGVIPASKITCLDCENEREIALDSLPETGADVPGVPYWRRDAWHKKLLKNVARAARDSPPELLRAIQAALNRTQAEFAKIPKEKHNDALKQLMHESDLVFGVFKDASKARGWDYIIIKGEQALAEGARNNTAINLRLSAIPCREPEEAVEIKQVFGGLH
jgi:hypothetical protein